MKTYSCILGLLFLFPACSTDVEEEKKTGIYGIVSDVSGTPLNAVTLMLAPTGRSTVTGTDGSYSFSLPQKGIYHISIDKDGYVKEEKSVPLELGEQKKVDFILKSIPAIITASVDSLDFGGNDEVRAFSIENKYYQPLRWEIVENCPWISAVKPDTGCLVKDQTEAITVFIDRQRLRIGRNETTLIVRSSTNGSAEVRITATGIEAEKLTVNILEAYPLTTAAILNGEIVHAGQPAYVERGFVYGRKSMPTLESTLKKLPVAQNDGQKYSYRLEGLPMGETYYVRAYAINAEDTAYSSNETYFTTAEAKPVVVTEEAMDIEANGATLRGRVVSPGDPAYTERGFIYGKTSDLSMEEGNKIIKDTDGKEGMYSLFFPDLPIPCYVRAYATNPLGTVYGEVVKIEIKEIIEFEKYYELPSTGIAVQKTDIGYNDWTSVKAMCENSITGGYNDWRLPTQEELMTLYTNQKAIGGFDANSRYWSSSSANYNDNYYYVHFSDGSLSNMYPTTSASGRCVRKLTK